MPHEREPEEIVALAQVARSGIGAPVTISGATVHVRASIGVAIAPVHGEDRKTLLRHADFAMYRAKQRGGGVARHNDNQNGTLDRPSMIAALREAIHTSSLTLNYQPKLRLATCRDRRRRGAAALDAPDLRGDQPRPGHSRRGECRTDRPAHPLGARGARSHSAVHGVETDSS